MRFAAAAILTVIGCAAVLVSWGPLHNLFADYRDSPVATYLLLGLPWLVLAAAAFAAAWRVLRS